MEIKFCGNHSLRDVELTANSAATYIGFVFAPSKRRADSIKVKQWLQTVPIRPEQQVVGVFVNPSLEEIANVYHDISLDVIQLHGNESPEQVILIKNMFQIKVWKVIHHSPTALEEMNRYRNIVDGYLIDTKSPVAWGGTGKAFDWTAIPNYLELAHLDGKPCFIAGGINPDNVRTLLRYRPDGIDLATGIEINNQKDREKISLLLERVELYESNRTK